MTVQVEWVLNRVAMLEQGMRKNEYASHDSSGFSFVIKVSAAGSRYVYMDKP
ncbi:MAG: hypothetical protein QX199_04910 [Methylococcaceae bacterium]